MPKLHQPPARHVVSTRDGGGITADHVLGPGRHFNAARIQVLFDRMPILGFAEVGEEMAQPVITEIERRDALAAQVAQGMLHAFDVCGHCHFPVVPFREDIR